MTNTKFKWMVTIIALFMGIGLDSIVGQLIGLAVFLFALSSVSEDIDNGRI